MDRRLSWEGERSDDRIRGTSTRIFSTEAGARPLRRYDDCPCKREDHGDR